MDKMKVFICPKCYTAFSEESEAKECCEYDYVFERVVPSPLRGVLLRFGSVARGFVADDVRQYNCVYNIATQRFYIHRSSLQMVLITNNAGEFNYIDGIIANVRLKPHVIDNDTVFLCNITFAPVGVALLEDVKTLSTRV
jgi:hypothetical protein